MGTYLHKIKAGIYKTVLVVTAICRFWPTQDIISLFN